MCQWFYGLISAIAYMEKEHSNLLQCSGGESPFRGATDHIHLNQDMVPLHRQAVNNKFTAKQFGLWLVQTINRHLFFFIKLFVNRKLKGK